MTKNLSLRNLDDELVTRLNRRAARHGRSAEAEARDILRLVLTNDPDANFERLAAELRAVTADRRQTPSEQLVREGRDER
jgi:antitoxin FitA